MLNGGWKRRGWEKHSLYLFTFDDNAKFLLLHILVYLQYLSSNFKLINSFWFQYRIIYSFRLSLVFLTIFCLFQLPRSFQNEYLKFIVKWSTFRLLVLSICVKCMITSNSDVKKVHLLHQLIFEMDPEIFICSTAAQLQHNTAHLFR